MYKDGVKVFVHADINDIPQTVFFPGGHTTATDSETNDHISLPDEEVTINDKVEYTNLLPEKTYEIKGTLMDKETGKALIIDGKEVTATKKFTTPAAKEGENTVSGTVDVAFEFEGYKELENDDLVAFETVKLASNSEEVFEHNDINDISQTVVIPELHTSVYDKSDRDKEIVATGIVTLIDEISYKNLIAGKKYIIEGIIMDKETGKVLMIDGKEVTATATFIADKTNGTTSVEFNFDASKVKPGEYVVFETVKDEETKIVVAEHKDIEDKDQTFTVKSVQVPPTITKAPPTIIKTPKTGDSFVIMPIILIALAIVSIFISLGLKKKYN